MNADLLLLLLVMVLGCAAFIFGILYLICNGIGAVGRGVWGLFRRRPTGGQPMMRGEASKGLQCPNSNCRNIEYRDARFCSRCGNQLNR